MTRLTLAGLALALLAGCDMTASPDQAISDYLPRTEQRRTACTHYVEPPEMVAETDSTGQCPYSDSGSYAPILVRTTWIGTNSACSLIGAHGNTGEATVIGGNAGIRRFFGCYKRAPAHPVKPRIECVDCDWGK